MFIIGIILIFTSVYNRPPQKSEACAMARPIVKIAVGYLHQKSLSIAFLSGNVFKLNYLIYLQNKKSIIVL